MPYCYTPLEVQLLKALEPFANAKLLLRSGSNDDRDFRHHCYLSFETREVKDALITAQRLYDKHKDAKCTGTLSRVSAITADMAPCYALPVEYL